MVEKNKIKKKKFSFEDKIEAIDAEILKRKQKWQLNCLSYIDFDDVSQIIRIHIYNKWSQWDQTRPLANWLNAIITNQMINLVRNHYGYVSPPCNNCNANQGGTFCSTTPSGVKCSECPLYRDWQKNKESAYNLKLAASLDNADLIEKDDSIAPKNFDIEHSAEKLHELIKNSVLPFQWKVYKLLYIDRMSEEDVARSMGYRSGEKNRSPGYKQINNIKRLLIKKAKELILQHDIVIQPYE